MSYTKVLFALTLCVLLYTGADAVRCECSDAVCSCLDKCPRNYGVPAYDIDCPSASQTCCIKNPENPASGELEDIMSLYRFYERQEELAQEIANRNF